MSSENQITKTPEMEKKEFIENIKKWNLADKDFKNYDIINYSLEY